MKLKININDENPVYELLDNITAVHLKNTRKHLKSKSNRVDIKAEKQLIQALDILIDYFGV